MRAEDFDHHLSAALDTRPIIEQAKGVLVGLRRATPEQAFEELRHASNQHNTKLRNLAEALVNAACGRPVTDAHLRVIIWREWGHLIPELPQP